MSIIDSQSIFRISAWASKILPDSAKGKLYQIPFVSSLLRLILTKAAPSDITTIQVAGGILNGKTLRLNLKKEKYYWLGTYEYQLQQAVKDFVRAGMVIYDIGANIGYVSLLFAYFVKEKGHVYAFEPLPENIKRLQEHININKQESSITLLPYAVSDSHEITEFLVHESHGMGKLSDSTGRDTQYCNKIKVQSISIDDFVYDKDNFPPDVVKMDIEGGEIRAITGMKKVLKEKRPILFLELHGPKASEIVWHTLKGCSYKIKRMLAGYPEIMTLAQMEWKEYIVAFPEG